MKISKIETLTVFAGWRNWVLVKVSLDDGRKGFGEATVEGREKTVAAAVQDLGRRLVGRNPLDIEGLYQLLYRGSFWRGGIILGSALSGIEQALWDLAGQYYSTPVYRLLGGTCRNKVKVYASGWIKAEDRSVHDVLDRAQATVARGFRAIKVPCFLPHERTVSAAMVDRGLDLIRRLRETLGPEIEIMVELHGRFPVELTQRAFRGLQAVNPAWVEEPTSPEGPHNLERIALGTNLPIASGERLVGRHGFLPIVQRQLVTFVQPDLCHVGGILEAKKIASLAEMFDIRVAPHNPLSPISTAACTHFAISTPNFYILELVPDDVEWREEVFVDSFYRFEDGYLHWDEKPGIGITVDEEAAARYPYQPVDLPFLTQEDGGHADW